VPPPPFDPEIDLPRHPVIVVGWWSNAAIVEHHRTEDVEGREVILEQEYRTTLVVDKVLKGDLSPGTHQLLLDPDMLWMMQHRENDALDPTRPALWFLVQGGSWDRNDTTRLLRLHRPDCVQPVALAEFFLALSAGQSREEVVQHFSQSGSPIVLRSVLRLVESCHREAAVSEKDTAPPMGTEAVQRILRSAGHVPVRQRALKTYCLMNGRDSLPLLRSILAETNSPLFAMAAETMCSQAGVGDRQCLLPLLGHSESAVRLSALRYATRCRIPADIEPLTNAISLLSPDEARTLLSDIEENWDDTTVPVAMRLLQHGNPGYGVSGVPPAVMACELLRLATGVVFPYDVARSLAAWKTSGTLEPTERRTRLASALRVDPCPVHAGWRGVGSHAIVTVRNAGPSSIVLTAKPSTVEWHGLAWPGAMGQRFDAVFAAEGKADFIRLTPGETTELTVPFPADSTEMDAGSWVGVSYGDTGRRFDVKAWVGYVRADMEGGVGANPSPVLETWPNGNRRVSGQTVDGRRHGVWGFHDKGGIVTRFELYSNGVLRASGPWDDMPDLEGAKAP